ncbi:hydrogenase, Fe-only [Desulfitobacterium dehalogenans ATCC 51507]|uniref:Hydrogenase, Fe-only n=1 Tax=Desulfitobacterium dehalogenans (strain ATCC 51507 / DSM 9161 / JW/IU-DC1) TaxID=756499 RepID=I4AE38_DESDJ|nr:[FeFe] hydrogenase, group A [Desulfitobacterium dehalogenans]AFM02223.1 hydrogenase, Fe-only [Desulfitobacterium dehalogenans ATCC 51507]
MASKVGKGKNLSRRSFLKFAGGASIAGVSLSLTGCGQPLTPASAVGGGGWMPTQYNEPGGWPTNVRGRVPIDPENPSIIRDDQKCILCGQCIEVCKTIQSVYGNYELPIKNDIVCIHCGQCIHWCPSGAISEREDSDKVLKALSDPNITVVVQTAPATRIGLGEEFGMPVGTNVQGKQVAALRELGFDVIFDTNFTADLTIMEEGSELVKRITGELHHPLPQLTSCCPGWVKFVEYFYPDLIPNLSSAKSPQQMEGALVKTYFAEKNTIDPKTVFSVAIMPCTAKKFECQRPEMISAQTYLKDKHVSPDVDVVLTTRELARMIKRAGIDFPSLPDEEYDQLMGIGTGAGAIFGTTGGVMEAAVRSAYYLITGQQPPSALWQLAPVRGMEGVKEASVPIPGAGDVKIAVISGLDNARKIMEQVRAGNSPWAFIEVMACPGGCQYGGGQPRSSAPPSDGVRNTRAASLYKIDANAKLRNSHDNPQIKQVYEDFLTSPLSEKAEELLHTHYISRAEEFDAKKPASHLYEV